MKFPSVLNKLDKRLVLSNTDVNIVFDGNSLTSGVGANVIQDFPLLINNWLVQNAKSVTYNSFGIGGQLLQTMVTNAPTKTYPLVNSSKVNILVLNEDANGLLSSYTTQQNIDLMNQYIDGAKTAGYNYIISWNMWYPRLPFDLSNPTPTQLARQKAYFDAANSGSVNSFVNVDMRLAPNIGGGENQNQNPVYFNDYIHLKTIGYSILASEIIAKGFSKIFIL